MHALRRFAALCLASTFVACGGGTTARLQPGSDCASGGTCEAGTRCFSGRCRPEPGAACDDAKAQCIDGYTCETSVCRGAGGSACDEKVVCGKAFTCAGGSCAANYGGRCDDAAGTACAPDMVCTAGSCLMALGGACDAQKKCVTGGVCEAGRCKAGPGGICQGADSCSTGYLCKAGICRGQAGAECSDTVTCVPGMACELGECRADVGGSCGDAARCRTGLKCEDGTCRGLAGSACTDDQQCGKGTSCHAGKCMGLPGNACSDTAPCTPDATCETGVCRANLGGTCGDAVRCKTGLKCEAATCRGPAGSDCADDTTCQTGLSCHGGKCMGLAGADCSTTAPCAPDGTCEGGVCRAPLGMACGGTIRCSAGLVCEANTCKASSGGTCGGSSDCVSTLACSAGKCVGLSGAACADTSPCASGAICEQSICRTTVGGVCGQTSPCASTLACDNGRCRQPPSAACAAPEDCTTGYACRGGVCVGQPGSPCGGQVTCASTAVCEAGTCRAISGGSCSDTVPCSGGLLCDAGKCAAGAGAACVGPTDCASVLVCSAGICRGGSGTACTQTSQCRSAYTCDTGSCRGVIGTVCSTPQPCVTGLACESSVCLATLAGGCTGSADCVSGLSCSGGKCLANVGQSCARPQDCAPGASCEDGLCRAGAGTACADDATCAGTLVCQGAVCVSLGCSGKSCTSGSGGTRVCQRNFLPNTASCEDGLYCTVSDHCDGNGACVSTTQRDCSTTVGACKVAACDETRKACVVSGDKTDGTTCDADSSGCTQGDSCKSGVCAPGAAPDCTAVGDSCNTGVCRSTAATTYACDRTPKASGTACDDGRYCTVSEKCDGAGTCAAGVARDCAAQVGDQCNGAYCDDSSSACVKTRKTDGTVCDDGNGCTLVDKCSNGLCQGSQNVCIEERLNVATNANTSRPAIASLGYGRYVTQWAAPTEGANYIRISDNEGSRENEEAPLPNGNGLMGATPALAVRSSGDFLVSGINTSGAAYSYNPGVAVSGETAATGCRTLNLGIPQDLASINSCSATFGTSFTPPTASTLMQLGSWHGSAFTPAGTATGTVDYAVANIVCTPGNCGSWGACNGGWTQYLYCTSPATPPLKRQALLALSDGSFLELDTTQASVRVVPIASNYSAGAPVTLSTAPPPQAATPIPTTAAEKMDAAVVPDGTDTYVVSWVVDNNVLADRFDRYGAPNNIAAPVAVATAAGGVNLTKVLPFASGKFLVLWDANNGDGNGRGIRGRIFYADGSPMGAEFGVNKQIVGDQRLGDAARFSDDSFVVAYDDSVADVSDYGIRARKFSATGVADASDIVVNTITLGDQVRPGVATLAADEWVVSFTDAANGVWTRRFKKDGTPSQGRREMRGNTTTTGPQTSPRVGVSAGDGMMFAYESPVVGQDQGEVLARAFDVNGKETKAEFQANTLTTGKQFEPTAAGGPDRFVVLWTSVVTSGQDDVKGQLYDGLGNAVGSEFTANSTLADFQRQPAVAMDRKSGDFLAVWNAYSATTGSLSDVMGRVFKKDGTEKVAEFRVNTTVANPQQKPAATVVPTTGDYVVGWESSGQDGSGFGVYLRKFLASGVAGTNEVQANTTVTGDQRNIALAATGTDLLACWETPISGVVRIACQDFKTADLTLISGEFLLGAALASETPTVAALPSGDFLVGWAVTGADSQGKGVQYVRLSNSGQTISTRITANRTWANDQWKPQLAAFSTGNFMAGWQSELQDGDSSGVVFRLLPGQ